MIYTGSYISKLGTFSTVCRFSLQCNLHKIVNLQTKGILPNFTILFQYDLHKIIHLQTMGILPSFSTKKSSLNMIHTRSHVFETKGIRSRFSIDQIFKLKGTPPSLPLAILINKVVSLKVLIPINWLINPRIFM